MVTTDNYAHCIEYPENSIVEFKEKYFFLSNYWRYIMVTTASYARYIEYPKNSIVEFKGKYFFLSNYFECKVTFEGITYESSEAAFQAQKCKTADERIQFMGLNPSDSKQLGCKINLRSDWEMVKHILMYQVVKAKFDQNPKLKKKLLATGTRCLIEGNTWHDTCWGVEILSKKKSLFNGTKYKLGKGFNHLGIILMRVRTEYQNEGK